MAFQQAYKTGTAAVTLNSKIVTGTGTSWALHLVNGGTFIRNGLSATIEAVESDTSLVLDLPWPAASGNGAYAIDLSNAAASDTLVATRHLREIATTLQGFSDLGRQLSLAANETAARQLIGALSSAAAAVGTGNLANAAVTLIKLQSVASGTFLARSAAGVGAPQGLTAAQALALLGFSNTLTGNGVQRLGGGLILQWGISANGDAADYRHVYPVTFPTETLCGVASVAHVNYPLNFLYGVSMDAFDANSFALRKRRITAGGTVTATTDGIEIRWMALGR